MKFQIDSRFTEYLKNIRQIFLYIIDECNLDCVQCLYKPNNKFTLKNKQIDLQTAKDLIHDFRKMGAVKLTIMGGEPTLYGQEEEWEPLLELIQESKDLGYEYVRIDTNGTFDSRLLEKKEFRLLDEITFSLDGPTKEINDAIRGENVFKDCVSNIKKALSLGYNCNITCCIHKELIKRDEEGNLFLDRMIRFAESINISRINFHDLFKAGIPRDCWSGEIDVSVDDWFDVWSEIQELINSNRYSIPVRIPQSFTTKDRFEENKKYYGYCSAKLGERALIHPDGIIRICSLMIGTPYGIAKYYDNKIVWDESYTNELGDHDINSDTPCTHQHKGSYLEPFVPVCVSFKPEQDEFVWNKLAWENKKDIKALGEEEIKRI